MINVLKCYIINLDRAADRWDGIADKFSAHGLDVVRIPAIDGKDIQFPHPDFAAWRYFLYFGRKVTPSKIACYFSHIKAIRTFLESGDDHAMICEDDVYPRPELRNVVDAAMEYSHAWDMLRLNGIRQPKSLKFADLVPGYSLVSDLRYVSGNGAKIVNRYCAERIVQKLLPMRLPHDVTLFYDWPIGIREVSVNPFPIVLNEALESTIGSQPRYPAFHPVILRHLTSFPYRMCSRSTRLVSRCAAAIGRYLFPPKPVSKDN